MNFYRKQQISLSKDQMILGFFFEKLFEMINENKKLFKSSKRKDFHFKFVFLSLKNDQISVE